MSSRLCPFCMHTADSDTCPHCGRNIHYAGSPAHLPAGFVVTGKHPYVLGAALGQGGFGITYIALDMVTNQRVAVKEYYPTYCSGRTSNSKVTAYSNQEEVYLKGKDRFLDEARTLKSLSDLQSIVNVLDYFEANNTAYLVMEFLEGSSLKSYAAKNGKFPARKFLEQVKPLMEDIQKMHDRGVIHRDIAPDNIILQPDGQLRLIDFGAARSYVGEKSMTVVVKKGFAPLEQYFSTGSTPSTDVYALAATIYYCITGTVPMDSAQRQSENAPLKSPSALGADLTLSQEKALLKALEIQQKVRTQTVREFLEQLQSTRKPVKPVNPKILAAIAACLVLAAGFFLFSGRDSASPAVPEQTTPQTAATQKPKSETDWVNNVLVATPKNESKSWESPVFDSSITREHIITVTFLDSLEAIETNSWDVSQAKDGSVMAWTKPNNTEGSGHYDLYIAAEGGINGKNCANLFDGYSKLTEIHFNNSFHTDYAESMERMFHGCWSLTNLDLSELETGRTGSMENMFTNCSKLENLNISKFDTQNVTTMSGMFSGCGKLTSLDLQHFDTSKVTNMHSMFSGATSLKELDISSFDTSNVTDMHSMFSSTKLTMLDLRHFNTSKVTHMAGMFDNTRCLEELDISSFDTSEVTDMSSMFAECALAALDLKHFNTSKVTNMESMFSYATNLKELDLSSFDTSNVTDMTCMFSCSGITALDLSHFDTSSVTVMRAMFSGCEFLETVDARGWNTANVTYMLYTFAECPRLETVLGVSDWNTSNVEYYDVFMDEGKKINGQPWEKLFK